MKKKPESTLTSERAVVETPVPRRPSGHPPSAYSLAIEALEIGETLDLRRSSRDAQRLLRWPSWIARRHPDRRYRVEASRLSPGRSTVTRLPSVRSGDFDAMLDRAIAAAEEVSPKALPKRQGHYLVTIDLRSPAGVALRSRGVVAEPTLILFPPRGRAALATFRDVLADYGIPTRAFALKPR